MRRDQLEALVDSETHHSILIVSDRFLIREERPEKLKLRASIALLYGVNELYGDCSSGKHPKKGEAREVWLHFELTPPKADTQSMHVVISRMIDYNGVTRDYELNIIQDGKPVVLDPNVSISLKNDTLIYHQDSGLLGAKA